MDSREFAEWIAYYRINPFGDERADLRSATIAATVYNCNRGKAKAAKISDFMPKFDKQKPQTPEQMHKQLAIMAKALG